MHSRLPVAFWLIPAQPHHRRLSALIRRLAAAHEAPAFEPHVSLHVGEAGGDEDVEVLMRRAAAQMPPFEMRAALTAHGPTRFKTLYVEFDDARPAALQGLISRQLRTASSYDLRPHLSLLYREALDEARRQRLAAEHDIGGRLIRFDTLAAVLPGPGQRDLSDVPTWDTTLRVRLGAA